MTDILDEVQRENFVHVSLLALTHISLVEPRARGTDLRLDAKDARVIEFSIETLEALRIRQGEAVEFASFVA